MSIKKSLRYSIILLASLPVMIMAILSNIVASNRYVQITKESMKYTAQSYAKGFSASLESYVKQNEVLAGNLYVQTLLAEKVNTPSVDLSTSTKFAQVKDYINNTPLSIPDANACVEISMYDVDGYYVMGTGDKTGDWSEYSEEDIDNITSTKLYDHSIVNEDKNSIDVVTPVILKNKVIGLIRSNIPIDMFYAFITDKNGAFILTSEGRFLFDIDDLKNDPFIIYRMTDIIESLEEIGAKTHVDFGSYVENSRAKYIYSYSVIPEYGWIYVLRQDMNVFKSIQSSTPILLFICLSIILIIAIAVSNRLSKRYSEPIMQLNSCMLEGSSGNYNITCDIRSNNEFGQLSKSFNEMMRIISETNTKQLATQKQLEENEVKLIEHNKFVEELAYTDSLTRLLNRPAYIKKAGELVKEAEKNGKKHAVIFIDLDDFKNVNDTLGHDYGDGLLVSLSEELKSRIRQDDILARTGGDEFLLFVNGYRDISEVEEIAKSLVSITEKPFEVKDQTLHNSLSLGIATYPEHGETLNELIKNADIAMYSAKNAGKSDYRFFDSSMAAMVSRKNLMIDILEHAIEKREIHMVYQPQLDVGTGKISGCEALMRLTSDKIGEVSPGEFIPIAEECGMINRLGDYALFDACTFNNRLINEGFDPIMISVNVSTQQLVGNHILDVIDTVKNETGMPLEYLELEFKESILIKNYDHNYALIQEIKKKGVKVALDDFGSGYSSLNYLTQFPIDTLKLDKTYIDKITASESEKFIADTIISLAHRMNIRVVAEGVEEAAQFAILQQQMCDVLQGYYFSKPITENEMIDLLTKKRQY